MSAHAKQERAAEWVYRGLWKVLSDWFRVPQEPPALPVRGDEAVRSFHPARGFLRLLKFQFWFFLFLIDIAILVGWLVITVNAPLVGAILAVPAFLIAVVPDIFAYVAIHLRYDTTWYVLSGRSMRVRRGVWRITEQTITFENVQDVHVTRGPFQQLFKIANVTVSTAGAGSARPGEHGGTTGNTAVLEGVDNPEELRDLIMARVRASRSAGLGDEEYEHAGRPAPQATLGGAFSPTHVALLREIRNELRAIEA